MPEAVTNVLRPPSLAIILIALCERVLNAVPSWPSVTSLITPSMVVVVGKPLVLPVVSLPWLRYAAIASPEAIPVTDGCGIDFLIFLLGLFLRVYARLAVFRTIPLRVERLRDFDESYDFLEISLPSLKYMKRPFLFFFR